MATFRKRGSRWQVQVRRKDMPLLTRSFATKADGQAWARQIELEIDRQDLTPGVKILGTLTVGDILTRYLNTVTPTKRGAVREGMAVRMLLKHKVSSLKLDSLTVARVAEYRDDRLKSIKPASINRELAIFRHAFETARRTWDIPLRENPFAIVPKPKVSDARNRRLEAGEWERLEDACRRSRNPYLLPIVEVALETAMRRGEVLQMKWGDVNLIKRTLYIPMTKNGHPRIIPLTLRAIQIIQHWMPSKPIEGGRIFPTTEDAVKMAWRRMIARAGLQDLRYHDLRHEAITRFFEIGLAVHEVALISGHRDTRMLMRYTHLRAESIAQKLASSVKTQSP